MRLRAATGEKFQADDSSSDRAMRQEDADGQTEELTKSLLNPTTVSPSAMFLLSSDPLSLEFLY